MAKQFDVIVVGASAAGCTTAKLYSQLGLRVALLEREREPSFKKVCTHFLQPVIMDAIRAIGLEEKLQNAGAVRNNLDVWTEWGWVRTRPGSLPCGYNIRRETLDPMLRDHVLNSSDVTFFSGSSITAITRDASSRISSVIARTERGTVELDSRLVVAADGRLSTTAKLAGSKAKTYPNGRFTYFTYYKDLPLTSECGSQYWHLHPDLAYAFRNDDDTTLLGIFLPNKQLKDFKKNPQRKFRDFWDRVPDGPPIGEAQPICELRGITKLENSYRCASGPGIAYVGDAAMVLDPIWGTGCSFAFASAKWLVDATADAMLSGTTRQLDRALDVYRRKHRRITRSHQFHITSFSTGRPMNLGERLVFSSATRDPIMAQRALLYLGRTVGLSHVFGPSSLLRAMIVNGKYELGRLRQRCRQLFGSPINRKPLWQPQRQAKESTHAVSKLS